MWSEGLLLPYWILYGCEQLPTEEEQFIAYKQVVKQWTDLNCHITMDIGGDKKNFHIRYKKIDPFLGW